MTDLEILLKLISIRDEMHYENRPIIAYENICELIDHIEKDSNQMAEDVMKGAQI